MEIAQEKSELPVSKTTLRQVWCLAARFPLPYRIEFASAILPMH
jgi:hypothetical protein